MKPNQFILAIILFLGLMAFMGSVVIDSSENYNIKPSDKFTETMTGNNYTEYQQKVEEIKVAAEDDGYLAKFKLAKAIYNVITSSFDQVGALITNLADYLELPAELVGLFIVIVVIGAIFGGLYLIIK